MNHHNLLIYPGHASAFLHLSALKLLLGEAITLINRTQVFFEMEDGERWYQRYIIQSSDSYRVRGRHTKRVVVHWSCITAWDAELKSSLAQNLAHVCRPNPVEYLEEKQEQFVNGKHWLLP